MTCNSKILIEILRQEENKFPVVNKEIQKFCFFILISLSIYIPLN